jgi:acetyltransferase-like isoleucine patch superfamily enzyme
MVFVDKKVTIGKGTLIEGNVVIGKNVRIGCYCLISGKNGGKIYIDKDSVIGDFTKISNKVMIGKNSNIASYVTLGHPPKLVTQNSDFSSKSSLTKNFIISSPTTIIGKNSIVRSHSAIYSNVKIGDYFRTGHGCIIREHVSIGKKCLVGTQAVLDGYVKVGDHSMIQSQCYITQTTKIGKGVFIAPHCVTLDNKNIILGEGLRGPTIGNFVRIGGNVTILPTVKIEDNCLIGANSVVVESVPKNSLVYGHPAKVIRSLKEFEVTKYKKSVLGWK